MEDNGKSCYPFVWFDRDGWWFKVFDECFGPYERPVDAQHNLLVIQGLSRQLNDAIDRRSISA